jgi:hypothetical protein
MSTKAERVAELKAKLAEAEAEKEDAEETLVEAKHASAHPEKDPRKIGHGAEAQKLNEDIAAASEDTIATLVEEIRELRKQLAEARGGESESVEDDEHTGANEDRGFFANIWGSK